MNNQEKQKLKVMQAAVRAASLIKHDRIDEFAKENPESKFIDIPFYSDDVPKEVNCRIRWHVPTKMIAWVVYDRRVFGEKIEVKIDI